MAIPNIPGINSLANKIILERAVKVKETAIEITKNDLEVRTGIYLDSFHIEKDGPLSISVRNTAQYAAVLELGSTKTWKITARNAPSLRFLWMNPPAGAPGPAADGYHYFYSVTHRGAKAFKILRRAMIAAIR